MLRRKSKAPGFCTDTLETVVITGSSKTIRHKKRRVRAELNYLLKLHCFQHIVLGSDIQFDYLVTKWALSQNLVISCVVRNLFDPSVGLRAERVYSKFRPSAVFVFPQSIDHALITKAQSHNIPVVYAFSTNKVD